MANNDTTADKSIKVLLVEDNPGDALLFKVALRETTLNDTLEIVNDLPSLFHKVSSFSPDILIIDLGLPGTSGISTLIKVTDVITSVPIVVLTGLSDDSVALEALRHGAQDYLIKGEFNAPLIQRVILYAIERHKSMSELNSLSMAISQSPTSIVITDRNGSIMFANPACLELSGYQVDEVIGKNPSIFKSGLTPAQVYQDLWSTISAGEAWHGELLNANKEGDLYWELAVISPVKNNFGEISHFIAVKEDITEKKKQDEKIAYLATHDPLTRLPNRTLLMDRIEQAIIKSGRSGELCSLLMIDLNDFKLVNDTYGHIVGDGLLCEFSQLLATVVRDVDTISRQGGDEFVILLEGIHCPEDAIEVAWKILDKLKKPLMIEENSINLRCSIGCSTFPIGGRSADQLLRTADIAMYRAKPGKESSVQNFEPEMDAEVSSRQYLSNELKAAIPNNQFELFYQPQIALGSGKLIGLEALIRWRHPEQGLIMPDRFISLSEETGMIIELGDWVIEAACMQLRNWLDQGLPAVPISVNVASPQFQRQDFFKKLMKSINRYQLDPGQLDLEITESTLMEYPQKIIQLMHKLVDEGFSISVDDFGTGYSSLSYLKRLPTDRIKIDKSFVDNIDNNSDDYAISSMIINLGKSLGKTLLAEGVETEAQQKTLENLCCDQIQGYLVSRPSPVSQISQQLTRERWI